MKLIVLSPDLQRQGGVSELVSAVLQRMADGSVEHLPVGRRLNQSGSTVVIQPLVDCWHLAQALRRTDAEVIWLNPSFDRKSVLRDGMLSLVAKQFGMVRLVFFHGWEPAFHEVVLSSPVWRNFFRMAFVDAGYFIVLAPAFKRGLMDLGVAYDRIEVRPTAFDGGLLEEVPLKKQSCDVVVLFLSRMIREKGVLHLVDGFARVSDEFPSVRLVLAGDGEARAAAEEMVRQRALGDRVSFPGYVRGTEKADLLRSASVFALPTTYGEGFPVSVLEAMAAGCALLTTHAGGLAEVVCPDVNGVVLGEVTGETVAAGLRALLSDRSVREAMGARNQVLAWSKYEVGGLASHLQQVAMGLIAT